MKKEPRFPRVRVGRVVIAHGLHQHDLPLRCGDELREVTTRSAGPREGARTPGCATTARAANQPPTDDDARPTTTQQCGPPRSARAGSCRTLARSADHCKRPSRGDGFRRGTNPFPFAKKFMRYNVAHERPSKRAKPACEGPPRWAGYASQPPANASLVCSVLWTKERGQHALLGFDLELIDIEHEHWQKKKGQKV